jgi:hypothetical protein
MSTGRALALAAALSVLLFAAGTGVLAAASARALAELPPDARLIWQQQRRACAQAAYLSATLATALTDLGDPRGAVLIEYRSGVVAGGAYETGDVTTATLSALDAPTAADGPLC